ncbi:Hypothetical protein PHPALM_17019 [Phytophthora palmivora]|uniref:Pol protein n=1 Tax=Phytophthora palmivora TaxID=4796 RepID=A0A2P4XNB0_9STRA|nr:Hypothetical protein PHPALM_17019 [Phytophthora palmivora]
MTTHPTFYERRLKRYYDPLGPPSQTEEDQASTEFLQGGSRNSAVNAPMNLVVLTTKSVQILTKDLKGPRFASLRGSLTIRSKPKGYLDRVNTISKLTDLVA